MEVKNVAEHKGLPVTAVLKGACAVVWTPQIRGATHRICICMIQALRIGLRQDRLLQGGIDATRCHQDGLMSCSDFVILA